MERLCEGGHVVEVGLRPDKTVKLFKEAIDRDYIHVKFTQTKGGAEIGLRLDRARSDLSKANFEEGTATAHVEGNLLACRLPNRSKAQCTLPIPTMPHIPYQD